MRKYRTPAILLLILVIQVILWRPFLFWPLEQDEGVYAYIGQSIGQGQLPYKDVFDHKPPLIYYVYSSIFALFGNSLTALRVVTLISSLTSTIAIFLIASMLLGSAGGLVASFFYAVLSGNPHIQGTSANTETFMMLALLFAWFCALLGMKREKKQSNSLFLLAGALAGGAVMFKQVALLNLLVLFSMIFADKKQRPGRIFALFAGSLLFPLIFSLYFLYRSAFIEFISYGFFYNLLYLQITHSATWQNTFDLIRSNIVLIFLALAGTYLSLKERKNQGMLLVLVWTGFSFIGAMMRRYYYGHYFIQVLPGLAILAAYPMIVLKSFKRWGRYLLISLSLILFFVTFYYSFWLLNNSPDKIAKAKYHINSFVELPRIGVEINHVTRKEDRIFVWGTASPLYYYSNRRSASRFIYINPIFLGDKFGKNAEKAMLADIIRNKPKIIIWQRSGPGFRPSFRSLEKEYKYLKDMADLRLYTRKSQ